LKNGIKERLSTQQLVDCSEANYGCSGGDTFLALRYMQRSDGINTMSDYPYTARDGKCRKLGNKLAISFGSVRKERLRGNETRLRDIVASVGPVAIAMHATEKFTNFKAGVYNNPRCPRSLNHAMLLVGYGYDEKSKLDYWLVKNSWGTSWVMQLTILIISKIKE
jgi:C1A family cysteine protease